MNIRFDHAALTLDRTYWTVLCDGEAHTFSRRAEVDLHTASTFGAPFTVVEWNVAENSAHDVTLDFLPDEDEDRDEPDGDFCMNTGVYPRASGWRR